MKVAVIGGGIAGLSAAHRLLTMPRIEGASDLQTYPVPDLTLFEALPRLGGIIETVREDGLIVEQGPDSFITVKPQALDLCRQLGLQDRLIATNENSLFRRAFIARKGTLVPIPQGFSLIAPGQYDTFFKSELLGRFGKLRMALEQFIPPGKASEADESVASFVRRRFGEPAVHQIAQPMLGGIYTADIERLSARCSLEKFMQYEQEFGSVSHGLQKERRASRQKATVAGARYDAFLTVDSGLETLVEKLAEVIGRHRIRCSTRVSSVKKDSDGRWMVSVAGGEAAVFDAVVLAVPSYIAGDLIGDVDVNLQAELQAIRYASSAVISFLWSRPQISHPLDGFGFVVPASEKRSIIAGSFASIKFAGRCRDHQVLIRAFLGGVLQDSLMDLESSVLIETAVRDLSNYLGIDGQPEQVWFKRYSRAMPQYDVGHRSRINSIANKFAAHKNLFYAGAALEGVGLPDCVKSGQDAAQALYESLLGSGSFKNCSSNSSESIVSKEKVSRAGNKSH